MAICERCGNKYSKWTTPVSAKGQCRACFESEHFGMRPAAAVIAASPPVPPPLPQLEQSSFPTITTASAKAISTPGSRTRVRWSSFVPRSRSKLVFAFTMACYGIVLSQLISAWGHVAGVTRPAHDRYFSDSTTEVIMDVVAAPVIESLVLIGIIALVRKLGGSASAQICVATSFMSLPHGVPWWPWAVAVIPSFAIQAASYLYWCRRDRWTSAYWVVVLIHALCNLLPAMYVIAYALR